MSKESQCVTFTNSGAVRSMIPSQPLDLKFQPDKVVFKQMVFGGFAVTNGTLYYLWCSLTNDYIGVIHYADGFITIEPMTTFSITNWPRDISFRIDYGTPPYMNPSGVSAYWSITLDFIKE